MQTLWAPWRMEFIEGEKSEGCVLCALGESELNDDSLVLARGQQAYVVMNRYPYSNGHLMIVPYQHTAEFSDLNEATSVELIKLLAQAKQVLGDSLAAQGYNVGINLGHAAGAGIAEHIHFHIVPRWVGDTNFMPVFSDTRVMPEALKETYNKLKQAWEAS